MRPVLFFSLREEYGGFRVFSLPNPRYGLHHSNCFRDRRPSMMDRPWFSIPTRIGCPLTSSLSLPLRLPSLSMKRRISLCFFLPPLRVEVSLPDAAAFRYGPVLLCLGPSNTDIYMFIARSSPSRNKNLFFFLRPFPGEPSRRETPGDSSPQFPYRPLIKV